MYKRQELDLAYAPPYSSAKDPVNMAGFMIEDLESGKVRQFHWDEVEDLPRDGSAALLDEMCIRDRAWATSTTPSSGVRRSSMSGSAAQRRRKATAPLPRCV